MTLGNGQSPPAHPVTALHLFQEESESKQYMENNAVLYDAITSLPSLSSPLQFEM